MFWLWLMSNTFHSTIVGESADSFKNLPKNVHVSQGRNHKGKSKESQIRHCNDRLPIIEIRNVIRKGTIRKSQKKDTLPSIVFLHSLRAFTIESYIESQLSTHIEAEITETIRTQRKSKPTHRRQLEGDDGVPVFTVEPPTPQNTSLSDRQRRTKKPSATRQIIEGSEDEEFPEDAAQAIPKRGHQKRVDRLKTTRDLTAASHQNILSSSGSVSTKVETAAPFNVVSHPRCCEPRN
ncbi:hypothetical protein LSH36_293g03000 [Paralvinella palmiformis]|uniref:Uncharacterized protein n=1 Tax=Paralvinella palmiformis TaxID=53620 RepID=A0AAD9N3D9_9ANNE|nr:hypothetical protein LSH36_293g03000 [Paralvinella palmiformis]